MTEAELVLTFVVILRGWIGLLCDARWVWRALRAVWAWAWERATA